MPKHALRSTLLRPPLLPPRLLSPFAATAWSISWLKPVWLQNELQLLHLPLKLRMLLLLLRIC
jgi:hypothetical protein